jgi:hypothetical protein
MARSRKCKILIGLESGPSVLPECVADTLRGGLRVLAISYHQPSKKDQQRTKYLLVGVRKGSLSEHNLSR